LTLFKELKRRNVFRVVIAYVIIAWLLLQVGDTLAPALRLPEWVNTALAFFLILGFPLAIFFAWAFELTPEGIKKEKDIDRTQSIAHVTGRKLDFTVIGLLGIAVIVMLWDGYLAPEPQGIMDTAPPPSLTTQAAIASIAVLPFTDLSPAGDQEYFADGLSGEILNVLVGVDSLAVASRTSSFQFRDREANVPDIAADLKVAYVLEGSVRKAGGAIRVTGQLIEAASDRHLWSDTFDRELTTENIFAIQDEIANAIVTALRDKLGIEEAPAIRVAVATQNMSAYDLYLKAHQLFITRTTLDESVRLFEEAVRQDPGFARAWEGLAAVYAVMPGWGYSDRDYLALADHAAEKALALDETLALAHATVGSNMISRVDGTPNLIMDKYNTALTLEPKNATLYMWRGLEYLNMGYIDASTSDYEKCLVLDPLYDNCRIGLAANHILRREPAEGVALYLQAKERGFGGGMKSW